VRSTQEPVSSAVSQGAAIIFLDIVKPS
jgi:hypothetical protein